MVEEWPKVVGLLIGVGVLAALVWFVQWMRERNAKARERNRVWMEGLAATDNEFLADCGIASEHPHAGLALGLRRVIVDCYAERPPVNADDPVDVKRLGSTFLDDGFDSLDFWFRIEKASLFRIPREPWEQFLHAVFARQHVRVKDVVSDLMFVAAQADLKRDPLSKRVREVA